MMLAPCVASAQPVDHARAMAELPESSQERFAELLGLAQSSFEQGDFVRVIAQLDEAYAIYPFPRILYKLAEAQERAGDLQSARQSYQRYLDSGDEAQDRAIVQGFITNLDRRLSEPAMLVLSSSPTGALVYLNAQDEPIGATPLRYPLTPGRYTVRLDMEGYDPMSFDVDARYGTELVLDRRLDKRPGSELVLVPDMPTPGSRVGIVSAVLGVGGGALFLLARGQANKLDDAYDMRRSSTRQEGELARLTTRHNVMVGSAWALTALGLMGSTWSVLQWRKGSTLSAHISPSGASLSMEITF